jgi:hypothetical protein
MSLLWARADRSTPANFQDNYYIYVPNLPAAIVALVLWAIVLSGIVYRSYRFKVWYLTVMVVGLVSMNPPLFLARLIRQSGACGIHSASVWTLSS